MMTKPTIQVVSNEGVVLYRAAMESPTHLERRSINNLKLYPVTWTAGPWRDTREEAEKDLQTLE